MEKTSQQFHVIIGQCRDLFLKKSKDYGTAWSILRMPSVTDQILIKAERIRSVQEKKANKVGESLEGEFMAIINYCIIALILLKIKVMKPDEAEQYILPGEPLAKAYDEQVILALETMQKKNHDYGEAWRKMRVSSITDLILMKIYRLKQIEDNDGTLLVSEGPDANYIDMLNYAVFSLIKLTL